MSHVHLVSEYTGTGTSGCRKCAVYGRYFYYSFSSRCPRKFQDMGCSILYSRNSRIFVVKRESLGFPVGTRLKPVGICSHILLSAGEKLEILNQLTPNWRSVLFFFSSALICHYLWRLRTTMISDFFEIGFTNMWFYPWNLPGHTWNG